ncbi:MAG TPA: type I-U CRISPR-associated protein Cas7, partial [Rhodospirillales bacterium]|nr:type I-U CRISPR-associated protein Cas7 [Rhodospirillales bacterium]
MPVIDLAGLRDAVREDAAVRRIRHLAPAGGPGDKVFPPTYPDNGGPTHVFEERMFGGERKSCVLLDSVQSQANRMELALRELLRGDEVWIPH